MTVPQSIPAQDFAQEVWCPIADTEGLYEVSTLGRVRTWRSHGGPGVRRARAIPLVMRQPLLRGYPLVRIAAAGAFRTVRVNRLVLTTFCGPCPPGFHAAHLNGRRADNRLTNLRWVSKTDNEAHKVAHGSRRQGETHPTAKLSANDVRAIRAAYGAGRAKQRELAERYHVSRWTIRDVLRGRNWAHVRDGGR